MRKILGTHRSQEEEQESSGPRPESSLTEAEREIQEIERDRSAQEEAALFVQIAREQEQAALNAQIDKLLSDDPEEFLRKTTQPGGE
jgi:hypothetical protein